MQSINSNKITYIDGDKLLNIKSLNKHARVVDVRDRFYYEKEHIKGAISIPINKLCKESVNLLEKEESIIVYCKSSKCLASTTAAKMLFSLGYENVSIYNGGFEDYKKTKMPTRGLYGDCV